MMFSPRERKAKHHFQICLFSGGLYRVSYMKKDLLLAPLLLLWVTCKTSTQICLNTSVVPAVALLRKI